MLILKMLISPTALEAQEVGKHAYKTSRPLEIKR
jgi:hypothetical protein